MKHYLQNPLFFLLFLLAFNSCKQSSVPLNGNLKADQLPSQLATISTSRDNYIKLSGGTIIQIPANALKNANGDSVNLEIKEALTLTQMISAGLYTRSNGELLSSGGMLYIAPQTGQDVKILKPIKVIMPAEYVQDSMQLFKGEIKDAAINWVDPQPLEVNNGKVRLGHGKLLYQSNCAPCHNTTKKLIGPALFGTMQRWNNDTAAVYLLTRNSAEAIQKYPQAACLFNEYKIVMPLFPGFTDEDLYDIYQYIHEEGMKKLGGIPEKYTNKSSCDSCEYIQKLAATLYETKNGPFDLSYDVQRSGNSISSLGNMPAPAITEKSTPLPPVYYSFDIYTFGWYNVDCYLENHPNTYPTNLKVVQKGYPSARLYPVMVLPAIKVIQPGIISSDSSYFYFYEPDGNIQLPRDQTGYIFSFGEKEDTVLFGMTQFITGNDQTVKINIQLSDKKSAEAAINKLYLSGGQVNIGGNDKETSNKLRAELERLREKFPNCLTSDSSGAK